MPIFYVVMPIVFSVAIALWAALTGFVYVTVFILLAMAATILVQIFAANLRRTNSKLDFASGMFGPPLTEDFKIKNRLELGIYRDELSYLAEIDGRTCRFGTIEEARTARFISIARRMPNR